MIRQSSKRITNVEVVDYISKKINRAVGKNFILLVIKSYFEVIGPMIRKDIEFKDRFFGTFQHTTFTKKKRLKEEKHAIERKKEANRVNRRRFYNRHKKKRRKLTKEEKEKKRQARIEKVWLRNSIQIAKIKSKKKL